MFGLFRNKKKSSPKKVGPTPEQKRKEYRELYTICVNNARYIRSSINVMNSVVNSVKGNNAAETKRKREAARLRLAWLKLKLPEEEGMVEYYGKLSGILK